MDTETLARLLAQSTKAQGQVPQLQMQMAEAKALRNAPEPVAAGNTGYVNPLEFMTRAVQRDDAHRMDSATAEQLRGVQQAQGTAADAKTMYDYSREDATAEALRKYQDKQMASTIEAADLANRNKLAAVEQKQVNAANVAGVLRDTAAAKRTTKNVTNPFTNEVEVVEVGPKGVYYQEGGPVENQKAWTDAPKRTDTKAITDGGGYGNAAAQEKQRLVYDRVGKAYDLLSQAENLPDADKVSMDSVPDLFKRAVIEGFTPGFVKQIAKESFSGLSREAKAFMVAVSRMSATERHALFGAALTKKEAESSAEFATRVSELSLSEMVSRLQGSYGELKGTLSRTDNFYQGTKMQQALESGGYGDVPTWSPGVSLSELSDEDLAAQIQAARGGAQ